jgi:alpha-beta hydrolase superfamily lysophospholipase
MDRRALEDVASMAGLLRARCSAPKLPLALRGSSMGGCLAIVTAPLVKARAVVAISPASPAGLRRSLLAGRLGFQANVPSLDRLLATQDLQAAVSAIEVPLLVLHAAGDEQVPVQYSHELAQHFASPQSRLIVVPGGHHRSVQHDAELQAVSVRFIAKALGRV